MTARYDKIEAAFCHYHIPQNEGKEEILKINTMEV